MATTIERHLARRDPFEGPALARVLAARAVAGLERVGPGGTHARVLGLAHGSGVATVGLGGGDAVTLRLRLEDPRDEHEAVGRVRRWLDLDADPAVVDAWLGRDPQLGPLVARRPGLRVLGAVDPFELALRAVIGQQVSVAAARTVLGRIVLAHGPALPVALDPDGEGLRRLPGPAAVAGLPDDALPMPRARAATVRRLAAAVADGSLDLRPGDGAAGAGPNPDPDAARARTVAALIALPGIGPWTAGYVAMRGLGDRDAFPAGDLVLRRAAAALGLPGDARGLARHAERWAPWRAYAAQHLWTAAAEPR